jgi:hypothetical protein
MQQKLRQQLNQSMQPMRASRSGHLRFSRFRRLALTADNRRKRTAMKTTLLLVTLALWSGVTNAQTNPVPVANIQHQTFPQVIAKIIGDYLYYAPYGPPRTFVYDITNPTNPVYLAETSVPGQAQRNVAHLFGYLPMAISERYAYLASDSLHIVDTSNPTNFLTVAGWHSELPRTNDVGIATALDVSVSGNRLYLADGCDGLFIFDISSPTNLVQVGHTEEPGRPTTEWSYRFGYEGAAVGVAVFGRYAFVANWFDGLRVYDVSSPARPVSVGHVADPAYSITISGGLAYVFTANGTLNIYTLSEPSRPELLSQISGWALVGLALSGNFLYLDSAFQGVWIYDVSDPARPIQVGHTDDISGPNWGTYDTYSIAVSHNHLYLGLQDYEVRIYSLARPARPQLAVTSTTTNTLFLSWPAPTGAFAVQQSAELATTNWVTLTNPPLLAGGRNQVILPAPDGPMFYRLVSR